MRQIDKLISKAEELLIFSGDIDVVVQPNDFHGDFYTFLFKNKDGSFEINYMLGRIPLDAWAEEEMMAKVIDEFENSCNICDSAESLSAAIDKVFSYYKIPKEKQSYEYIGLTEERSILLVLSAKDNPKN